MVCIAAACPAPDWHRVFLSFLPKIVRHAKLAFRHLRGQDYQDAIQETVANALVAFVRLVHRGKMNLAYPTVLAKYAVAQINDGRRVGNSLNCSDVLSSYCQRLKDLTVERLDRHEKDVENEWCEVLIEDKTAGPFDIVRTKLDFESWLRSLPQRDRKVAQFLSLGNRTSDAAKKFNVSQGRVSQLRRELQESWNDFTSGNAA
jgi:hypothetical protein